MNLRVLQALRNMESGSPQSIMLAADGEASSVPPTLTSKDTGGDPSNMVTPSPAPSDLDVRPDTLSGTFRDQWSFLRSQDAHAHPSPPSSYLRSDRSSRSPLQQHYTNGSRSSFSRNLPSASTGGRSTTTVPPDPVLIRETGRESYYHNNPQPRVARRPIKQSKQVPGMPAREEFSMQGMLHAIQEDVEGDINTIAEALGRSRLVLADQHDSHMPPQGEIRGSPLHGIEEIDADFDHDNILIARSDGSFVEGSDAGSAAYGLLQRLQVRPLPQRITSEVPLDTVSPDFSPGPTRTLSSPAAVQQVQTTETVEIRPYRTAHSVQAGGPAPAVVSETYLSAEANGAHGPAAPTVSEAGRQYPLYTRDDVRLFESNVQSMRDIRAASQGQLTAVSSYMSWLPWGHNDDSEQSAESTLRGLLSR